MIQFTDAELGFINLALSKIDPTGIIGEAQGIRQKIQDYAQKKQAEQAEQTAALADEAE